MFLKKIENLAGITVLIIAFLLTNNGVWLCLHDVNNPLSFCRYGTAGLELQLLFFASSLAIAILWHKGVLKNLVLSEWKNQKALILFILYAILSIIWTTQLTGTIYHILILAFSTILAVFLGTCFTIKEWSTILLWFSAIITISCFALLVLFPNAAIMAEPHLGSWRGIFWHKNFTGSFMALANIVFLLNLIISSSRKQKGRLIAGVSFYIMSLIFTTYSLSAAGIVILFILTGLELVLFLWSRLEKHLTAIHYYILGGITITFILISLTNIDVIFRLINRSPDLTGRTFLWSYLINSVVLQHPIVGHGFGAAWTLKSFVNAVTLSQGWGFPITNSHSGFMDTLINLGFIGFFLLLLIFISAFQKTGRYFIHNNNPINMLPLLVVLYVFLANLSISFIQEIESFHWMILISAIFIISQTENNHPGNA